VCQSVTKNLTPKQVADWTSDGLRNFYPNQRKTDWEKQEQKRRNKLVQSMQQKTRSARRLVITFETGKMTRGKQKSTKSGNRPKRRRLMWSLIVALASTKEVTTVTTPEGGGVGVTETTKVVDLGVLADDLGWVVRRISGEQGRSRPLFFLPAQAREYEAKLTYAWYTFAMQYNLRRKSVQIWNAANADNKYLRARPSVKGWMLEEKKQSEEVLRPSSTSPLSIKGSIKTGFAAAA